MNTIILMLALVGCNDVTSDFVVKKGDVMNIFQHPVNLKVYVTLRDAPYVSYALPDKVHFNNELVDSVDLLKLIRLYEQKKVKAKLFLEGKEASKAYFKEKIRKKKWHKE